LANIFLKVKRFFHSNNIKFSDLNDEEIDELAQGIAEVFLQQEKGNRALIFSCFEQSSFFRTVQFSNNYLSVLRVRKLGAAKATQKKVLSQLFSTNFLWFRYTVINVLA